MLPRGCSRSNIYRLASLSSQDACPVLESLDISNPPVVDEDAKPDFQVSENIPEADDSGTGIVNSNDCHFTNTQWSRILTTPSLEEDPELTHSDYASTAQIIPTDDGFSPEEFTEPVEKQLLEPQYYQQLLQLLSSVGGDNANDVTWNAASMVVSRPMAAEITWRTTRGKTSVRHCMWVRAIIDSVMSRHFDGTTRDGVEDRIQAWIKSKTAQYKRYLLNLVQEM